MAIPHRTFRSLCEKDQYQCARALSQKREGTHVLLLTFLNITPTKLSFKAFDFACDWHAASIRLSRDHFSNKNKNVKKPRKTNQPQQAANQAQKRKNERHKTSNTIGSQQTPHPNSKPQKPSAKHIEPPLCTKTARAATVNNLHPRSNQTTTRPNTHPQTPQHNKTTTPHTTKKRTQPLVTQSGRQTPRETQLTPISAEPGCHGRQITPLA